VHVYRGAFHCLRTRDFHDAFARHLQIGAKRAAPPYEIDGRANPDDQMENKANTRSLYVSSLTDLSGKVACVIRAETWTGHKAIQSLLASGTKVVAVTHVK
jgi:hypothetical protein